MPGFSKKWQATCELLEKDSTGTDLAEKHRANGIEFLCQTFYHHQWDGK
jgi:hypothetical protein